MRIHPEISDLFFNRDFRGCEAEKGKDRTFGGYDEAKLTEEAGFLIDSLARLGLDDLPTPAELVADFHNRV